MKEAPALLLTGSMMMTATSTNK